MPGGCPPSARRCNECARRSKVAPIPGDTRTACDPSFVHIARQRDADDPLTVTDDGMGAATFPAFEHDGVDMIGRYLVLIAAITAVSLATNAESRAQGKPAASPTGLTVVDSAHDMATTEARLKAALDAAGLKVAFRLDHAANARSVSLELAPTVLLIFGNPKAGTVLMQKQRTIGIDLPLKVLIWENDGKVSLAYYDPGYLSQRHGIDADDAVTAQIGQALMRLGTAATAP